MTKPTSHKGIKKMTKDDIIRALAKLGLGGHAEQAPTSGASPQRQFNSKEEIIAAIRPGVTFYEVIGRGGILEYECLSPWQEDDGTLAVKLSNYVHVSCKGVMRGYKAKLHIRDLQNHPDKGVFTDRGLAEKFSAEANIWEPPQISMWEIRQELSGFNRYTYKLEGKEDNNND